MKYLFTLVFALLAGVATTTAQTVTITKTDGSTVTYKASEIKSIQFANEGTPVPPAHNFTGYILVSSPFFFDTYYGEEAKMEVYTQDGKNYCKFNDKKWGTGTFEVKLEKDKISGSGTMNIVDPHKGGEAKPYKAMMSGSMTAINISVTGLMGGTTIKWRFGKASEDIKFSGTYLGDNSYSVMGMNFTAKNTGYCFWVNSDGTYSVQVLGQKIAGTPMGDITLGAYTIDKVSFDVKTRTFSKAYSDDNIKVKYQMGGGANKETVLSEANIKGTFGTDGSLQVENTFKFGVMPFPLTGIFNGKVQK